MKKIRILGNEISDLIAAGEVVERPASVVKELVENSIDAGADKITIEIKGCGIDYIRVTDNGCGMSQEDAKTAFLKHATSKISSKNDLFAIKTLGFRGEALCAISAVSKITLKTKEPSSVEGYAISLVGGSVVEESEIGAADGTTIEVRNLFFNTPARLKFIKSEQTERAVINSLIEKLAISHSNISFSYIINGSVKFITSGKGSVSDSVYSVYGPEIASDMIPVNYSDSGITVSGLTGKPLANKPNRNLQIFYVNGRLVKSKTLQQSLEISYKNSMLVGRYPICVLFIELDTSEVDVNVHPSKLEIKFSNEKVVANTISVAVRAALSNDTGVYGIRLKDNTTTIDNAVPNSYINEHQLQEEPLRKEIKTINNWEITSYKKPEKHNYEYKQSNSDASALDYKTDSIFSKKSFGTISELKNFVDKNVDIDTSKIDDSLITNDDYGHEQSLSLYDVSKEPTVLNDDSPSYRFVGEVFSTYIIIEQTDELIFIDKHALHERMIFEKLRSSDFIEIQTLLVPKLLFISGSESAVLLENKDILKKIGFDIDDFGGSLLLREIPAVVEEKDVEVLLTEISEELKLKTYAGNDLLDKLLYTISCKAAIKSGGRSSEKELISLIDEYFKNKDSLKYCPHGRPIVFSLTKKAIEKQFKRIVG